MTRRDFVFLTDMFRQEVDFYRGFIERATPDMSIGLLDNTSHKLDAILGFAAEMGEQLKRNNKAFELDRWNREVGLTDEI